MMLSRNQCWYDIRLLFLPYCAFTMLTTRPQLRHPVALGRRQRLVHSHNVSNLMTEKTRLGSRPPNAQSK